MNFARRSVVYFALTDVRKFFDSIDHDILKRRLDCVVDDKRTLNLLHQIIDSYEVTPGKGIPMGNQTSQWFALYYLDPLDRLVKEKLRIKHYTRYMDDCVLISDSKDELREALEQMRWVLGELKLEFNEKTQICSIKNGVAYLGWRHSLSENGGVMRRLIRHSRIRWQHGLRKLKQNYALRLVDYDKVRESLVSYISHFGYGNTWHLYRDVMKNVRFVRNTTDGEQSAGERITASVSVQSYCSQRKCPSVHINQAQYWKNAKIYVKNNVNSNVKYFTKPNPLAVTLFTLKTSLCLHRKRHCVYIETIILFTSTGGCV